MNKLLFPFLKTGHFKRIWGAFPKTIPNMLSWIGVSYGVLPILSFGLFLVLMQRTGSAGAVLVGCTIVSQALLQIWPMVGYLGGRKSRFQIQMEALNPRMGTFKAFSGNYHEKAEDKLRNIALESELNFSIKKDQVIWLRELTISRIYLSLEWCIVICAVIGTLVWAYVPCSLKA